jgi:hypothetical protein
MSQLKESWGKKGKTKEKYTLAFGKQICEVVK